MRRRHGRQLRRCMAPGCLVKHAVALWWSRRVRRQGWRSSPHRRRGGSSALPGYGSSETFTRSTDMDQCRVAGFDGSCRRARMAQDDTTRAGVRLPPCCRLRVAVGNQILGCLVVLQWGWPLRRAARAELDSALTPVQSASFASPKVGCRGAPRTRPRTFGSAHQGKMQVQGAAPLSCARH